MTVPEKAIEAAAREFHSARRGNTVPWADLARTTQDYYRRQARIHLRAAAPFIKEQALTDATSTARDVHDHIKEGGDGYSAGFHYALTVIDSIADTAVEARP